MGQIIFLVILTALFQVIPITRDISCSQCQFLILKDAFQVPLHHLHIEYFIHVNEEKGGNEVCIYVYICEVGT